jgi:glutamate racemase
VQKPLLSVCLALAATLTHCAATDRSGPVSVTVVTKSEARAAAPTALIRAIGSGASKTFPLDAKAYAADSEGDLPIGVFDSGIGGLTVLSALFELDEFDNTTHQPGADGVPDLADERFVYFGDQANMPYGRYASVGKEDFLRELIVEDAAFLLGSRYWPTALAAEPKNDKPRVKAVVVACNTATAYGIDDLRAAFAAWNVPMILVGVVEAGAEGAVEAIQKQGERSGAVAVMATVGTCKSGAYPKTIERYAREGGVNPPKVVQQGSVGLAGAIEGDPAFVRPSSSAATSGAATYQGPAVGNAAAALDPALASQYGFEPSGLLGDPKDAASWRLNSVENYVRYDVTSMVEAYRKDGGTAPISTVVLGCTHFPFQKTQIASALERLRSFRDASGAHPYESLVGPRVDFVDPAKLTAKELYVSLRAKSRFHAKGKARALDENAFFISKPNATLPEVELTADGTFAGDYKYGRSAGRFEQETVRRVPMRTEDLTPELRGLLRSSMPGVWASLQAFQSSRWIAQGSRQ